MPKTNLGASYVVCLLISFALAPMALAAPETGDKPNIGLTIFSGSLTSEEIMLWFYLEWLSRSTTPLFL